MTFKTVDAVKKVVALFKEGKYTDGAATAIFKPMSIRDLDVIAESLEISLCKSFMDRKLLKKDRAVWNMVKHRKVQVLAMAA